MKKGLLITLAACIVGILIYFFLFGYNRRVDLKAGLSSPKIIYDTKLAIVKLSVEDVKMKLKEQMNDPYREQYYYEVLFVRLDTATIDCKVTRTKSYKPKFDYVPDSLDPKVVEYNNWAKEILFSENHHSYELALDYLSLELIEEGKAEVYNKNLARNEKYIFVKELDDGLAWWSEYRFSNKEIFIRVMTAIR